MGARTRTELVPERGEMCWEGDEMWLGIGGGGVLYLGPGEMGLAHFGDAIYDGPDKVGWTQSCGDWKLTVEPGYRLEQIRRDGWPGDMNIFHTPLGDGFLFGLVRVEP